MSPHLILQATMYPTMLGSRMYHMIGGSPIKQPNTRVPNRAAPSPPLMLCFGVSTSAGDSGLTMGPCLLGFYEFQTRATSVTAYCPAPSVAHYLMHTPGCAGVPMACMPTAAVFPAAWCEFVQGHSPHLHGESPARKRGPH